MNATKVYDLLQEACRLLEAADEFVIAAHVSQAMALIEAQHAAGRDHWA